MTYEFWGMNPTAAIRKFNSMGAASGRVQAYTGILEQGAVTMEADDDMPSKVLNMLKHNGREETAWTQSALKMLEELDINVVKKLIQMGHAWELEDTMDAPPMVLISSGYSSRGRVRDRKGATTPKKFAVSAEGGSAITFQFPITKKDDFNPSHFMMDGTFNYPEHLAVVLLTAPVQASEDVQAVEAVVAPVVIPEPLEDVQEAVEEDLWPLVALPPVSSISYAERQIIKDSDDKLAALNELRAPAVEDVQEVELAENIWEMLEDVEVEEEEQEEVLTVSDTEKLLKAWKGGYNISRGARALGVNGIYIDYKIDGDRVVLTDTSGERVHWVTVVPDPVVAAEPVPDGSKVVTVEGRAYRVPPMPERELPLYTPMADLVKAIFAEALERVHVVPFEADMDVTVKRLKVSKGDMAFIMATLEGSRGWVLSNVRYESGRGLRTKWAEYERMEEDVLDVVEVEPLRGYVILRGVQAGIFANVPVDYLSDPEALEAVCAWLGDVLVVECV